MHLPRPAAIAPFDNALAYMRLPAAKRPRWGTTLRGKRGPYTNGDGAGPFFLRLSRWIFSGVIRATTRSVLCVCAAVLFPGLKAYSLARRPSAKHARRLVSQPFRRCSKIGKARLQKAPMRL